MRPAVPDYRLYGESGSESGEFWLHFETLPERSRPHRWEIAPHRHGAFFQIFNITKGGGELVGEAGQVLSFSAPAAIVIPAGAVHGFRFEHDSDGLVLTVRGDRLSALALAERRLARFFAQPRVVTLDDEEGPTLAVGATIERIAAELAGRAAGRTPLVAALIVSVLVDLARIGLGPASGEAASDPTGDRIERLGELIDMHLREHRPVGFYAGRLGLSPTHLNRIVRSAVGATVQNLIDARLVAEAQRELVFSRRPAKAVAFALGFADPAYFSRYFRKHTGLTPAAFRRSERQRSEA